MYYLTAAANDADADETLMGLLQRMFNAPAPEAHLLAELADIAGRNRELAGRLARHAALCVYPDIARDLNTLAERQTGHAAALDSILSERHVWSKLPGPAGAEGASNWARITGDLALMLELSREMNRQALHWEGIDPALSTRLRAIAIEDDRAAGELRKMALRCDPQALD